MGNKPNNDNTQKRQKTDRNNNTIENSGTLSIGGGFAQMVGSSAKNVNVVNEVHHAVSESAQTTTFEVFFSYVEEDQKYVDNLKVHLIQLVEENVITNWYGSKLAAGSDSTESMKHFNQASVILLLISPDYIASDYRYEEVERAMERRTKEKIAVIPVLIRPATHLRDTPLSGLQPIPRNGKAISQYTKNQEGVFSEVAKEIRDVIERGLN